MNKNKVNKLLPIAYEVLKSKYPNELPNEFRAYISTFGAAIAMGSLESGIAFYSSDGNSKEGRSKLTEVIFEVLKKYDETASESKSESNLFDYVVHSKNKSKVKDDILSATIAIKLATNMFVIKK